MSGIYVIAGEASGDQLGAGVLAQLFRQRPELAVNGIGGSLMQAEGLNSLFEMSELSVMGIAEIVPKIPRLLRRVRQTVNDIVHKRPDVLLTIDAPAFNFRVAKAVKKRLGANAPRFVHYVAPTVWAWKPGRAKKVAAFLDHLLVLLPFEPPYFEREGLATTFVGHPVLAHEGKGDAIRFRETYGLGDQPETILAVLPGSRRGEVSRLLPVFLDAIKQVEQTGKRFTVVLPTLTWLKSELEQAVTQAALRSKFLFVTEMADKWDGFAAADFAIAASGTATLELAVARTPTVLAYRVHPLTAAIIKRMSLVRYAGLVNILADERIQPEFIQDDCTVEALAAALGDWERLKSDQLTRLDAAVAQLHPPQGLDSSQIAAEIVLRYADESSQDQ